MGITAQDVKSLREKTGAGMMDCKKALQESNGDTEAAIEFLKKQGLAKAVKKGDRIAAEGLIFSKVEGSTAYLLELNCETDFVAKNDDFLNLGKELIDIVAKEKPASLEALMATSAGEVSVEEKINSLIAVIGEKISLRRFQIFNAKESGKLVHYDHSGGKISVLVEITGDKITDEVGKDVAMQITAMSPQYVDKSEVPQDVLDKEKAFHLDQMKDSGKPAEILEKIIAGKLDKFAGEMSLLQQVFVKDMGGKKKVDQWLKEIDPQAKVVQFVRFAVGEGIEKRQDDFADEVAKMVQ